MQTLRIARHQEVYKSVKSDRGYTRMLEKRLNITCRISCVYDTRIGCSFSISMWVAKLKKF